MRSSPVRGAADVRNACMGRGGTVDSARQVRPYVQLRPKYQKIVGRRGYSLWAPTRHSACRVYPPAPFRNGPRLEDTIEGYSEDSLFRTGARVGNRGGVSARKGGRATVERSCRRRSAAMTREASMNPIQRVLKLVGESPFW